LQAQHDVRNAHYENWTKLLLEQGALSRQVRVEQIARQKLQMGAPASQQVEIVKLKR
jgi:cell division protein FtsL